MSDYFFYDLNKKMADLANKQQLAEDAQATPVKPAPSALRTQLNERDMGKHNNATTGFAALAKKTGGGEKGAKIAGAQLAKMRAKGQVEEDSVPPAAKASASKSSSSKPSDSDYRIVVGKDTGPPPKKPANPLYPDSIPVDEPVDARFRKKPTNEEYTEESAFQAAIGKKKYGEQGMKALQKAGRDHASDSTMNKIRDRYDKYDESVGQADEGNAFSGAVVKAKRDGIQPGEKINVGGKSYPVKETGMPMTPKQKKFAKLAPPMDKITFADKIVGAKTDVDEMLGDVAADAMKNAVGKMRGRNRDMEEGFMDDEPTSRRSSTGGRIDTTRAGVTRHHAGKSYSGAGHDAVLGLPRSTGP